MILLDRLRSWLTTRIDGMVPGGSLEERTVKSGVWASATNFLSRGLAMLTLIILARLLDPNAFGLMGIALLTIAGFKQFSRLGMRTALIQYEADNVDAYLNTAWTMRMARGVILGGILFFSAPVIAGFFTEPRAEPILQLIALSPVLIGLRNPGVIYFRKSLQFHKDFVHKMSGATAKFIVSVGLALIEPTVYALVLGFIAHDLMMVVTSFILQEHRPWPGIDIDRARDMFGYGKWITGTGMLYYLFRQGDDIVVGSLLSAASLGFYQVAYQLSNAPATEVSHVVSSVMFPSLSKLQSDLDQLREAYFTTLRLVTLVAFPMGAGILAVAPSFVGGVMGEKWLPMVLTVQILAVFGLIRAFGGTFGDVFKAVGRPDLTTKLLFVNVVSLGILIYPATTWYGIEGAAGATLLSLALKQLIGAHLLVDIIETSYRRIIRTFLYPFVASATMAGTIILLGSWLPIRSQLLTFILQVPTGIIIYAGLIFAIDRTWELGITDDVENIVRTVTG